MAGDSSPRRQPNPKSGLAVPIDNSKKRAAAAATATATKRKSEFEFCKVCKLNHDQGQRHKYLPNHKRSLSGYLDRFRSKLGDVRFFLDNPSLLRPEHVSRNRFWCVFCDVDVEELDSSFACGNAINHLVGADHLKNLKHFIWKYGGAMDCLNDFRILDDDVAKWEKKCETLKKEAALSGEGSHGPTCGLSNGMSIRYPILDLTGFQTLVVHLTLPPFHRLWRNILKCYPRDLVVQQGMEVCGAPVSIEIATRTLFPMVSLVMVLEG